MFIWEFFNFEFYQVQVALDILTAMGILGDLEHVWHEVKKIAAVVEYLLDC